MSVHTLRRGTAQTQTAAAPTYAQTVLADSPLLYWRLGEASGTTAADSSTGSHPGTYVGGFTLGVTGAIAGDANKAVDLDGTNGAVTSAYTPCANGTVRTFEGWAWRDLDTDYHHLFGDGGTNQACLRVDTGAAGNIQFFPDAGFSQTWAAAWPGTAQWVHWALIADEPGNTAELYINGVSAGGPQSFTWSWGGTSGFQVGLRAASDFPWNGKMDEVAVYGSALSSVRIAARHAFA